MKYSSRNLNEPGIERPLQFKIKIVVEFRPGGVLLDQLPVFYTDDPEGAVDEIVRERGWDRRPDYRPFRRVD
jgi:hypothetical protein